jgi:hypothetical protein
MKTEVKILLIAILLGLLSSMSGCKINSKGQIVDKGCMDSAFVMKIHAVDSLIYIGEGYNNASNEAEVRAADIETSSQARLIYHSFAHAMNDSADAVIRRAMVLHKKLNL